MAGCSSTSSADSLVKEVLNEIEEDGKFSVDTLRANLAKRAAKFILSVEQSSGYINFAQQLLHVVNDVVDRVKAKGYI